MSDSLWSRVARGPLRRTLTFLVGTWLLWKVTWAVAAMPPGMADKVVATPVFPTGDEQVEWIRIVDVPGEGHGGVTAAAVADGSIYLAGNTYIKESGTQLWVWRVGLDGKLIWKTQLAEPEVAEPVKVLRLLANEDWPASGEASSSLDSLPAEDGDGVIAIFKQGLGFQTKLAHVDVDGKIVHEHSLGKHGDAHGVLPLAGGELVLFGSEDAGRSKSRAWVARVDLAGSVRWKQIFDPESVDDPEGKLAQIRPGRFHEGDYLAGATELADGSIVLVGATGVYNKFGQGVSKLWLLRLSSGGETLAERFIDDGRVGSKCPIAVCRDGVIVSFTRSQLPPIAGAPYSTFPKVDTTLARFDADFEQIWEQQLPMSFMPGAATLDGPRPYVTLSAWPGTLVIRAADESGGELWRSEVATPEAWVLPVGTFRVGEGFVAVSKYRSHVRGAGRDQTLVVGVRAGSD